ncbi:MAG: LPP20 family lipoprotein [Bacteroidales bacterium]|nr:LPP20 family lipoprotein [Bacteroidales bacterium]
MKNWWLFTVLVILSACKTSQEIPKELWPEWAKNRPKTDYYYIGIAKVDKNVHPTDYQETAKRIALNDLASEISVNIQSDSRLNSYEDNYSSNSDYQQYIKTEINKELSGYEMVDEFDSKKTYMVYYRLSKSRWNEIQNQQKIDAAERALSWYDKAINEKNNLHIPTAIQYDINALLELKKYWTESINLHRGDSTIAVEKTIKNDLVALLSGMRIETQLSEIRLSSGNGFTQTIQISVVNKKGQVVGNIPLKLAYKKSRAPYQESFMSSETPVSINISDVDLSKNNTQVSISADVNALLKIKSEDKKLLNFVYDAYNLKTLNLPIVVDLPYVYVSSFSEGKYQSAYAHHIEDAISSVLLKNNIKTAQNIKSSDVQIVVVNHESEGDNQQRFPSVYLSCTLEFIRISDQQKIGSIVFPQAKGADGSIEKAKEKAYLKVVEMIHYEKAKSIVDNIMK